MKKRLFLVILGILFMVSNVWAAGTAPQSFSWITPNMAQLVFTCTGDAADGTIPDTDTTDGRIYGLYLYRVIVKNTTTQTDCTDDSDVYILDEGAVDLLNGQGVDTLDKDAENYIRLYRKDPVIGPLTLDVNAQAEVSAVYTVTVILAR